MSRRHDRRCSHCRRRAGTQRHHWASRPARLVLAPGAYRKAPVWSSRRHWLDEVLPEAVRRGQSILRRHHIAPTTFLRVMAAHAQHADDATGRGCTPTVAHLQVLARCSERTIQRARAAARELGIGVEVFRGRRLTLVERMETYEAGAPRRGWASVYALGCPLWLARHLGLPFSQAYPQVNRGAVHFFVDGGTPPVGRSTNGINSRSRSSSSAKIAERRAPRAVLTKPPGRHRGRGRWNTAGWDLALALQQRIHTLRGVHPGRLAPALTRFALAPRPWTAEELQASIERVLRLRGWNWLSTPEYPAGYLARLLREIDHADQPIASAAAIEQLRALRLVEADERAGRNLCVHGVGGADEHGRAARCAFCRRAGAGEHTHGRAR
jgi:hypothetical protein